MRAIDDEDMNLVELSVDPDHLNDSISQYTHHHHDSGDTDSGVSN